VQTNPQTVAAKWSRNLGQAGQSITDGVNAVTTSPGQLAAAQVQKWLAAINASAAKWQRNVGALSLSQWQQAMINKGVPRIVAGATGGEPNMQAFMTQFLPYLQTGVQNVKNMPSGGLANGIARATAMITYNSKFQYARAAR
jgi:hypothetical protein